MPAKGAGRRRQVVAREGGLPYVDPYGWRLTALNLAEVKAYVTSGDLVMLEATFLTGANEFQRCQDGGPGESAQQRRVR